MKIKLLNSEPFVSWGNAIGLVLFSRENDITVNVFTEDMTHNRVNRKELGSPSYNELMIELEHNDGLRYLAEEQNLIAVTHQHTIDFLEYAASYN
jgi:hypothetical protein